MCVTNRLTYPESVNERLCGMIGTGAVGGVLPVFLEKGRKDVLIGCDVSGLVPFFQYVNGFVNRASFLDFVYGLLQIIKGCEANMMATQNLDLHRDRIFVDPRTGALRCIYWPVVNNQAERLPGVFFSSLPSLFCFDMGEGREYLERYNSFFYGIEPFSVNNFEKMILSLKDKASGDDRGHFTERPVKDAVSSSEARKRASVEYDPFAVLLEREEEKLRCPSCGTKNRKGALSCELCGVALFEGNDKAGVEKINFNDAAAFTRSASAEIVSVMKEVQKNAAPAEKKARARVVLVRTGREYTLGDGAFRMGKDPSLELCISDNTFISRRHAEISKREGKYYLTDLGSTNKTFAENVQLVPEMPFELKNNTKFRLANEEMVFLNE